MKETIIKVKGMMCAGCENRIKNALTELDNIKSVEANHKDGFVKIISNKEVNIGIIKERIEDLGFEII